MKLSNRERGILAGLCGRAIKEDILESARVTIDKLRYVDCGVFSMVARITLGNGKVYKNVYLTTDLWSPELEGFARKRGIQIDFLWDS